MKPIKSEHLDKLTTNGWFYIPNFLPSSFASSLKNELEALPLKCANVGGGREKMLAPEIRSDKVFWLEKEQSSGYTKKYLEYVEEMKQFLNKNLYLGLQDYEGHFAQYDKGAFYKKHKDNVRGSNRRFITLITYLNENWQPSHGGQLRLHMQDQIDIAPTLGSLIVFLSQDIEHEVLLAHEKRQAITGWFLLQE